jgi:hypothetical protein
MVAVEGREADFSNSNPALDHSRVPSAFPIMFAPRGLQWPFEGYLD